MSNHHNSSTFGTHLNPNGHVESFSGSHDRGRLQYSYSFQNPSFLYSQGQTNGKPIAPQTHSNNNSFRSNAQGVVTLSSGNEVNGALHASYGGQVRYNGFPTPEYPPMPFAHAVPSYRVQLFDQPTTGSNPPSNPSHLFSNPDPAAEMQSADIEDPDTVPPALSELEDGELDDEEVGKATGQSRASSMTPLRVSQHKRHENLNSADSEFGHYAANAPNKPLPGLNQGSLATPYPQNSTVSQRPGYPMPNGFIENSGDPQFSRTTQSTSAQHPQSKTTIEQDPQELDQHLVEAKMEEAKEALRDLHSQGFGFNQIVNAGLNPGVLRRLYSKIEVSVNASSALLQQGTTKHGVVDMPPESATGSPHERGPELSQKVSDGEVFDNGTMPHEISEEAQINGQSTLAAAKNERKSIENHASLAKSSQPPNVNPLAKASGIKASGTKIVDRKEYIARMLAAKAGKPAVSASAPIPSQTSAITDTGAPAKAQLCAISAPIVPAAILQEPCDITDTSLGSPKEDLDVETKRKAQTDLARQKIEALKLRESFQQQPRSATSNNQQSSAKGVPSVPAGRSAPTSQPLPNRQSSYFSPASQKPPFNIPGLFMTSDAVETANHSKPSAGDDSVVTLQAAGDAFGSSQEVLHPHAATSAEFLILNKTSSLPETSLDLNSTLPATIPTTSSFNRKRQRASDFNDSLSIKLKRPLGQQEDTSVIIDISDDDISNDTSGDESLETADRRDSLPRGPQVLAPGNSNKNPPKSLPALTDLPQRKKSVMMTPPTAQASGQSGDLNGLKSKEMEIEVMNRKIAELEQRIATKAKQNTSRSHSPRTSSRVTASPPSGGSSNQINNPPNIPLNFSESQDGAIANVEKRESSTTLAETNEAAAAAAEQLNVVQQLEQVERAKAEAERSLAAQTTLASAADQPLTREEGFQTRQAEEHSNLVERVQRSKDEEQEPAQAGDHPRLEESQSHQVRGEETKTYRQEKADHHLQERQRMLGPAAPQEYLQGQERKRSLNDQRQARKSEIELGLPLLDAEVGKTRKRLESLRQEITSLEMQLQKGIEGRQGLIEELQVLSRSREALPGAMDFESCDVHEVPKQSTNSAESTAVTQYSTSNETAPKLDSTQGLDTAGGGREVRVQDLAIQTTENPMSDGEVEEDIMDISRSDVDDTEPSLYSPKAVVQDTSNLVDDDENYEPPSELSMTQRQERDPDAILFSQDLDIAKAHPPAQTQNKRSSNLNAEFIEEPTPVEPSPVASVDTSSDEQSPRSLSRSPSPANASDPDDYEPPEPASLGHEVLSSSHMLSADIEASFSPRDVEKDHSIAQASSESITAVDQQAHVQKLESNHQRGHFTPYESPLKQFKSFRYHPRYLEEVSGGFRSLTYSHTINPDIPMCRYELDGVCNDDSCQSQHLRSVGLSDDKILVDLGAKPDDGSSPDEFGNGLREIIHDIRSRKIRDFNIVAGEITAYRAKFLGDSSKVLSL